MPAKNPGDRAAQDALAQRVRAVGQVLLPEHSFRVSDENPFLDVDEILTALVLRLQAELDPAEVWLVYAAIAASLPLSDEVQDTRRALQVMTADEATIWLLGRCLETAIESGDPSREVVIVSAGVLVDVTHSAQSILHTGIQQVVRNAMPLWDSCHTIVAAAWTDRGGVLRGLSAAERCRVMDWGKHTDPDDDPPTTESLPLVIPWRSKVILPEVPATQACYRLAAMAESGSNELMAVGYDCIPVVSADMLLIEEPSRFVHFLTVVKYASKIAAISASARAEFAGFVSALPTQGLGGPVVTECRLPIQTLAGTGETAPIPEGQLPLVLCVGSHEPRKNHLAVLYAAEVLWREGLQFELMFIGGSGFGSRLSDRANRLTERDRPITIIRKASDEVLEAAYRRARFTMFPSLHEGYGLPIAESMAYGTPVITANFGSMAQQLEHGGGLGIDVRDDDAVVDAMRRLLTDDELIAEYKRQLASIPSRSWSDYADELWLTLMPEAASS